MEGDHIVLHTRQPTKRPPLTNAEKCKNYRQRIRQDPLAYEQFKQAKNISLHKYLVGLTDLQKREKREKDRLRQQAYRNRKKAARQHSKICNTSSTASGKARSISKRKRSTPSGKTKEQYQEEADRRERNKLSQRKRRASMTAQRKRREQEIRRERYYSQKKKKNAPLDEEMINDGQSENVDDKDVSIRHLQDWHERRPRELNHQPQRLQNLQRQLQKERIKQEQEDHGQHQQSQMKHRQEEVGDGGSRDEPTTAMEASGNEIAEETLSLDDEQLQNLMGFCDDEAGEDDRDDEDADDDYYGDDADDDDYDDHDAVDYKDDDDEECREDNGLCDEGINGKLEQAEQEQNERLAPVPVSVKILHSKATLRTYPDQSGQRGSTDTAAMGASTAPVQGRVGSHSNTTTNTTAMPEYMKLMHLIEYTSRDRACKFCSKGRSSATGSMARTRRTNFKCSGCPDRPHLHPKHCFIQYHLGVFHDTTET